MRINRGMEGLAQFIGDSLKSLKLEDKLMEQRALMVWDEVVGDQVAAAAQPEFIEYGNLFVNVKSPVWANELTFHTADIVNRLNARIGGKAVKKIILRQGRVARPRKTTPVPGEEEFDLEGVRLTDEESAELDAYMESAPELPAGTRTLLETAIRIEKWRRAHGWTECAVCGTLQNDPDGVCPVCMREAGESDE